MALFPERFINQVAQATDIVEVIGRFVALKKRGREYMGLCPFHDDHRPSMYVVPGKQIFKCFVCQAGGGVYQFLMQYQKLSFPEVVRQLADQAGIPVPEVAPAAGGDRSTAPETLGKLMLFAARWFRDQLASPAGAAALEYAHRRKLTDESIARFGIGYAPEGWDGLRLAAHNNGFTDRQLVAAGLAVESEKGSIYDRFRNRLVFPIINASGKVIAFGGRALAAEERAKYLNSPETVLFDKSANLYAINWSRQAIVDSGQAVVVEGYMDALMCLQEGVGNVVATLGTALTDRHSRMLSRYAAEVVLVFDADAAGQAASVRAVELFMTQRLNVRVATVPQDPAPDGSAVKDPCDYVLAAGGEAMKALLAAAPDALAYAWSRREAEYRQAVTVAEKGAVVEDFLRLVVSSVAHGSLDPIRQGLVTARVGELVGVRQADLIALMRRLARQVRTTSGTAPAGPSDGQPAPLTGSASSESWLLGVLLNQPELFDRAAERVDAAMFTSPMLRGLAEVVWRLGQAGRLDLTSVLGADESDHWGRLVTDLQADAEGRGQFEQTLADAVEDILRRRRQDALTELKGRPGADRQDVLRELADEGRRPGWRKPKAP